jgi:hypothetical protein
MTPGTFVANRLFMDIRMAGIAFIRHFGKIQRFVTVGAGNFTVLTNELKFSFTMIKGNCLQFNFPAIRFMAITAIGF